jgi:glycosyltransferase involved in cell wall biosynthesis
MLTLTAIIISKNAEQLIADCIDSVAFCDEIIVVDAGSMDKTIDLAKRMHASVIQANTGSFAEQRNVGLRHAKGEWVLYIDTDERVSPSLREGIIQYTNNPINKYAAYKLKRKNFYFGDHEWPYIETLERLFKREKLKKWQGQLHESPVISGGVGELDGFLLHYTHRDLTSMLEKTIVWSQVEAELRFNNNHPTMTWWRFPRVMLTAFWDSYIRQKGYTAGTVGIIESIYQSFSMFITYARLWEMQQNIKNKNAKIKITK